MLKLLICIQLLSSTLMPQPPHIADVFEFDNTNVCSCCRGTSDQNCSLSTEIWAVKPDLRFVSNSVLPGQELLPFNLSQQNQQHYFERVDYYGAKLNRNSPANQRLYLMQSTGALPRRIYPPRPAGEAASVSDATGTSLSGLAESGSEH